MIFKPAQKRKMSSMHMAPVAADKHTFMGQVVAITTCGVVDGDQGDIVAQGVTVSSKAYNFPMRDVRRVCCSGNPAFDETCAYVLVTHVYERWHRLGGGGSGNGGSGGGIGIPFKALNPPEFLMDKDRATGKPTRIMLTGDDSQVSRNLYEDTFRWEPYLRNRLAIDSSSRRAISAFGFNDSKQSGKDMLRRLVPFSIAECMDALHEYRGAGTLATHLCNMRMSRDRRQVDMASIGGMDLRRFLLIEMLLLDTPLASLACPAAAQPPGFSSSFSFPFPAPCVVDGVRGAYTRLKEYTDAARAAAAESARVEADRVDELKAVLERAKRARDSCSCDSAAAAVAVASEMNVI